MFSQISSLLLFFILIASDIKKTNEPTKFKIFNGDYVCFLAEFNLNIFVPYVTKDNQIEKALVNLDDVNHTYEGACGDLQILNITMFSVRTFGKWHLDFVFEKGNAPLTNKNVTHASEISLTYHVSEEKFPNAKDFNKTLTAKSNETYFEVEQDYYFSCKANETIVLDKKIQNVSLVFNNLRISTFRDVKTDDFIKTPLQCSQDLKKSGIVPLIIGLILALLILSSLALFFVGVRRRQPGYEQL